MKLIRITLNFSGLFLRFIKNNDLSFKPYEQFGKAEITERTEVLSKIARLIWNDEMFKVN